MLVILCDPSLCHRPEPKVCDQFRAGILHKKSHAVSRHLIRWSPSLCRSGALIAPVRCSSFQCRRYVNYDRANVVITHQFCAEGGIILVGFSCCARPSGLGV
jgi:hypothetical protein